MFGVEKIFNIGVANTRAGNDIIIGTNDLTIDADYPSSRIFNLGTIITGDGNEIITGTLSGTPYSSLNLTHEGIYNRGSIYTGDGNDIITGINQVSESLGFGNGFYTNESIIDMGNGDDRIIGNTQKGIGISSLNTTINTGIVTTSSLALSS